MQSHIQCNLPLYFSIFTFLAYCAHVGSSQTGTGTYHFIIRHWFIYHRALKPNRMFLNSKLTMKTFLMTFLICLAESRPNNQADPRTELKNLSNSSLQKVKMQNTNRILGQIFIFYLVNFF